MSLVFACHFRGYLFFVYTRWVGIGREGPVPSDGVLKGHLYAWTVRLGFVAVRKFGDVPGVPVPVPGILAAVPGV